jgi:hypothetical protein
MRCASFAERFMATVDFEDKNQDGLALSVGRALALANEAAVAHGMDPANAMVTITEEPSPERQWRIHYGPRSVVNRRGGDLIVLVDREGQAIQRIIRSQ